MNKKILAVTAGVLATVSMASFAACGSKQFDATKNITVITREDGSGTKSAIMEMLGLKGKADVTGVIKATSTAAVLTEVKSNAYAIAYDSLGYITDEVKMLTVDGVQPTVENIKSGAYSVSRPLNVVYKADNVQTGINAAFMTFLKSKDAQTIIEANGYVASVEASATYTVQSGLTGKIDISGSTSLQPLMTKLAAEFEKKQAGVTVNVGGGGSGTGYNNAKNGVSAFGMISEVFKPEKAEGCVFHTVAMDGIGIIVNKNNPLTNITKAQLSLIYNCDAGAEAIKVWNQLIK